MALNKPMFSVNDYDSDGDVADSGIFLHFGDTRIKVADSIEEFKEMVPHFERIIAEIGGGE